MCSMRMLALRNSGVSADALTTGVCGFIFAKKSGQKVYLNGASFCPIFEFSGFELITSLPIDYEVLFMILMSTTGFLSRRSIQAVMRAIL